MMEAKSNKELIAIARYDDTTFYENRVDPDDLVEQLADRLEAAEKQIAELTDYADRCIDDRNEQINGCDVKDKEIARLRGLIVWAYKQFQNIEPNGYQRGIENCWDVIKDRFFKNNSMAVIDLAPFWSCIEQIVKEERGEK